MRDQADVRAPTPSHLTWHPILSNQGAQRMISLDATEKEATTLAIIESSIRDTQAYRRQYGVALVYTSILATWVGNDGTIPSAYLFGRDSKTQPRGPLARPRKSGVGTSGGVTFQRQSQPLRVDGLSAITAPLHRTRHTSNRHVCRDIIIVPPDSTHE
ncbi:uncharacterized protein CLUP02_00945 [Colletotrichum lupini]|uniref:Uncharacterized protein n=1 Tax=Colletotrichum lupini TaxID=145971 RepID=A0A9Q8SD22_9PEZI|nr:uncharacterized protein CLUP02_00945 [Colletotrichum lupini]UQC74297.1 hypothetical protein CLUP02_00945 [Colletotrichum lupini]